MGDPVTTPVVDGLFDTAGGEPRLIGSRCAGCGTLYFPETLSCRNPECSDKRIERALLGPAGRLHSFTVQRYQPPPQFAMQPWQAYAIGVVEVAAGLRVLGMIADCPLDELRIDMPLTLKVAPLQRRDDGSQLVTYQFVPAGQGEPR